MVGLGPEIFPRVQLVAVPYAMKVATVDGSAGGTLDGEVTITEKLAVGENSSNEGKGAVAIGEENVADYDYSAVMGGQYNEARAHYASVVGGSGNIINGQYGFIGGGLANIVDGFGGFVAAGNSNYAIGDFSFAVGNQARALHNGSIVLAANDCPT